MTSALLRRFPTTSLALVLVVSVVLAVWGFTATHLSEVHFLGVELDEIGEIGLAVLMIIPALLLDRTLGRQRRQEVESQRLAAIVESSDDAIIGKDLNGVVTSWNRGAERVFGYTAADMVGAPMQRLIPADRQHEEEDILESLRRGESVEHFDTRRLTKDGREIDVSVTASPIKDPTGRVIGASKVARDISASKRAERLLRKTEERLAFALDRSHTGGWDLDLIDRTAHRTLQHDRIFGYESLLPDWTYDVFLNHVIPEDRAEVDRLFQQAVAAHTDWSFECRIRRIDGEVRWIWASGGHQREGDGPVRRMAGIVQDITERKQATEALRAAEESMRFALQHANIGVWDMDYRTGVLRWSGALESHYGFQPGSFDGTFEAFIERVHPDDRASLISTIEKAVKSGLEFSTENRALWPDGTVRWLTGRGRIILGEDGGPVRGLGVSIDNTERHVLAAQYQQAQKMEAIGQLAGGVAHDFNNLLTAILGYCELLLADVTPGDPREADLAEIQKAGTTAAGLTRQLLAFSRKEIIEPTLLDLNVVASGLNPMLRRLIREDVKVVLGLGSGLAPILADRGQVEQVIVNLAVNAQDAMPTGGTLTIETTNVELDENYSSSHFAVKPGRYVVLTITDTGIGMTPEVQSHVFEPFFTTKEVGKGTGLGLATVHGIVTRFGGSVGVYSEVGRGTSFKVYFPAAETTADAPAAAPSPVQPRPTTETVLVVDDASELRELARRLLERQGYKVLSAGDQDDAIDQFERAPVDVLLTDVVMPGGSGPQLAQRLLEQRPDLKVIYMSGYTEDAIVDHGVLQQGVAFLHKPFTSETLRRKIREVLEC